MLNTNKEYYEYVKRLVAFRNAHPVLKAKDFNFGNNGTGYPEISIHSLNPWNIDEGAPNLCFAYMFAEDKDKFGTDKDAFIYVAVNAYWEEQTFNLPIIPKGFSWYMAFEAYGYSSELGKEQILQNNNSVTLGPRTTIVLIGK